jgi:hypothetical protein
MCGKGGSLPVKTRYSILCFAFLAFLVLHLSGCVHLVDPGRHTAKAGEKAPQEEAQEQAQEEALPEDFAAEIARLEKTADESSRKNERAGALLRLSTLYSHYDNPAPDYGGAHRALEGYARIVGEKSLPEDVRYRLGLLRAVAEMETSLRALQKQAGTRAAENRKLRAEHERLVSENTEMNEVIEKLKQLDVHMEKKRKELQ